MSITHEYAQSDDGSVRHISQVAVEYRKAHILTCLGCGLKMQAVLNVTRTQPFFRHSGDRCALETYLHKLGKKLFKELFEKNRRLGKPLTVDYHIIHQCGVEKCKYGWVQNCRRQDEIKKYDLLTRFTDIEIEKRDSATGLTPDILLSNAKGDKLYIEIYVKNPVTEEKEKKSSGIPIVEIHLESEEDLKKFHIEEGTTITDLQEFDIKKFNLDKIIKEMPYCTEEIRRARDSFKNFYTKIIETDGVFFISYAGGGKCDRECPFFATSRCLNGRGYSKIDLAHSYRKILGDECEYDCLVYQDEQLNKVRFAFTVGLLMEYKNNAVPTIQFSLKPWNNIFSWRPDNIVEKNSDSIAYRNFEWKNLWLCEKYDFKGFVLDKNGFCRLLEPNRIDKIYKEILAMGLSVEDYLIMGCSLQQPFQLFPDIYLSKAILTFFRNMSKMVKGCLLCNSCGEPSTCNSIYCTKYDKCVPADEAKSCEMYEVGRNWIDDYPSMDDIMRLVERSYRENRLKGIR